MRPSTSIAEHGDQAREILERAGMRNAKLFGSAARGEDTEDSDLDVLVEAPPGTTLYDMARVEIELEELLGCKVEVLTEGFLSVDVATNVKADLASIPEAAERNADTRSVVSSVRGL
ncbi:nucleotidyltransferase family protein [Bradyrhizobium betae]|uniref:Nucleotidyltransferase family protein n=1 Tax=Bradyrhizobium betae TaxID=244734 RepID=A0A5P6P8V7_9BRAD|nr:nucleotidyltransferase family protein [Bradyrhizobium betae]